MSSGPACAVAPAASTHRVLVLDGSYSMAYRPTDKTRFERAKELARQIVEESPQGDGFTLVLDVGAAAGGGGHAGLRAAARSSEEIDDLELPHTAADLPATLGRDPAGPRERPARKPAA